MVGGVLCRHGVEPADDARHPAARRGRRGCSRALLDAAVARRAVYAYRIGRWSGRTAWEAELVHHKLYLENPPPAVQHFEVTHGYNLATANRAWATDRRTVLRVGVGLVIAHPEGRVRGRTPGRTRR